MGMKIFENKKVKGAVSIFLVIITIPVMLLSAVLIDGSRMASARAITQEATDLAASSVLSSYNQTLKDEYGLFALEESDPTQLQSVFEQSLNATLLAYGLEDSSYSEQLWDIMKNSITGQTSYVGASFLNLYDFRVEESTVEPIYHLANEEVLENQMVEYAKYRGLYVIADRLDIFRQLGNAQSEAQKNQVTAEVMEEKMTVDEANAKANEELMKLREELGNLNEAVAVTQEAQASYFYVLKSKMEEIRIENTDTEDTLSEEDEDMAEEYETAVIALVGILDESRMQAELVLEQAERTKTEVEKAIERLKDFQSENQGKASGNEGVQELLNDAEENIRQYQTNYLPNIQSILEDDVIIEMSEDTDIASDGAKTLDEIDEAINRYIEEIEVMRLEAEEEEEDGAGEDDEEEELVITDYYYYYIKGNSRTTDPDYVISRSYRPEVEALTSYYIGHSWNQDALDPTLGQKNTSSDRIDENFAKSQSNQAENPDTNLAGEAERGEVEQAVYDARPSKTQGAENGKTTSPYEYQRESDLTASKNIMSQGKNSMILGIAETARDDVLGLAYMFGTFKTRLTGVEKFSSTGMSQADKDSFYMPKWRYAHPEGELDMRFTPKKDRETVLRSEIEYLIYGNRTDFANEAAVYATIYAERLANNMVALYSEKTTVKPACEAAAWGASALTGGFVPQPVFFWLFLTAWAIAETVMDMHYLIEGGYKIPLLKTNKNLLLDDFPTGEGVISGYGKNGIFVCYEDYLLIMLLLKGRTKRIMRTADLIEMNMKKMGESDFTMATAYTYLYADTKLSIRYLFNSVQPFQESYEEGGYGGRMEFSNIIYQGY